MEKYDTVIVGGGFCGALCAKILERKSSLSIALIDKKPYFEFIPAIPKVVINKNYSKKIKAPFIEILRKTKFILDEVTKITKDTIYTRSRTIKFKYLIICTGTEYPIKLKNKKNVHTLKFSNEGEAINKDLEKFNDVLIVGGGIVGSEIAGELATQTNKKVTMLHSRDRLINRNPEKASQYVLDFLTKKGVTVYFNEKVTEHTENTLKTNKGHVYEGHIVIWCTGITFKVPFLDKKYFSLSIEEDGHVKVNQYLQVNNYENIFAGGDIINTKEEKTAQNADRHAKTIAYNILHLESKKRLKKYKPRTGPLVISLGPWKGLFVAGNFVITGLIPGLMKHLIEMAVMFRMKNL
ncbi:FAD-dependent oxidoreductase [Candidatus Woesearchaeota archaeon]|nr:FAD-dependent oxidoreductase [Candidatus Woesearchaeota archaeon]